MSGWDRRTTSTTRSTTSTSLSSCSTIAASNTTTSAANNPSNRNRQRRCRPSSLEEYLTTATTTTADANNASSTTAVTVRPIHVVFVHLDLGIGGAEQLITQLALTSHLKLGHDVDIVTTRCDPDHCFAPYKPPPPPSQSSGEETVEGSLYGRVHVWGRWIPADLGGYGRVACSTLRLLYLAVKVARKKSPDLIVVDVLPTPLWILSYTDAATLYYCHFPDKLLKRQQQESKKHSGALTKLYRGFMNAIEEWAMNCADVVAVNSQFTRTIVRTAFPHLERRRQQQEGEGTDRREWSSEASLPVLYPAFDGSSLDEYRHQQGKGGGSNNNTMIIDKEYMVVSLNRYERKKNIGVFLEALAWVRDNNSKNKNFKMPRIVVAGGYDTHNVENVEHRAELGSLAKKLRLDVDFRLSIPDSERSELLHTAAAVVYTPSFEHFGIVPLEAMYAGTPVVAMNNGGPMETIVDGRTGFLCNESTAECFGTAILKVLVDFPVGSQQMGQIGRQHVIDKFGEERLTREWLNLTESTLIKGRQRLAKSKQYRLARSLLYSWDAILTLLGAMLITFLLRYVGILDQGESVWDGVRKLVKKSPRDEL